MSWPQMLITLRSLSNVCMCEEKKATGCQLIQFISSSYDIMAFMSNYKNYLILILQLSLFVWNRFIGFVFTPADTLWRKAETFPRVCIILLTCLVGIGQNHIQTFQTTNSDELMPSWHRCSVWGQEGPEASHYWACLSHHTCSPSGCQCTETSTSLP